MNFGMVQKNNRHFFLTFKKLGNESEPNIKNYCKNDRHFFGMDKKNDDGSFPNRKI